MHAYPRLLEMFGDDVACPNLLESEFRMGVQVVPQRREEGQIVGNLVRDVHRFGGTFHDLGKTGSALGVPPSDISDKSQNMNCLGGQPRKGLNPNATP